MSQRPRAGAKRGFLHTTFTMVSDPSCDKVVHWMEDGKRFVVEDEHVLAQEILPRFFKHSKFPSFVRQLNFYGFTKELHQGARAIFRHPHFLRGQRELLAVIKRKKPANNQITQLRRENVMLRQACLDLVDALDEHFRPPKRRKIASDNSNTELLTRLSSIARRLRSSVPDGDQQQDMLARDTASAELSPTPAAGAGQVPASSNMSLPEHATSATTSADTKRTVSQLQTAGGPLTLPTQGGGQPSLTSLSQIVLPASNDMTADWWNHAQETFTPLGVDRLYSANAELFSSINTVRSPFLV
ncbi:MAG: hypothetical protein MHM6MM_003800 [Cercozoa sp. M6MM]